MKDVKFLYLNLIQFIVYRDEPNVVNAVMAIGHSDKGVIIVRPEYQDEQQTIVKTVQKWINLPFAVRYGDAFSIDTWDHKIENFVDTIKQEQEEDEEDHYLMTYFCHNCDETWTMTHSCACNDRCPKCNAEIEPTDIEDL
jgi:hypothetical protein